MNEVEDALKAVEDLTEIMRDMLAETPVFYPGRVQTVERLNALRMGCEALRLGQRGSGLAQKILSRAMPNATPLPKDPGESPCDELRAVRRKCSSHPALSIESKREVNPLVGAAEGCNECLMALIHHIIGWTRSAETRP